jgi:hypothetical protein
MLRKRDRILAVLMMCVLSSCASLEKRAQEQLANGQYEQAAASYELLLKRDPSNAQARANLNEARSHVLADRLIDVRKLRMGGSPQGAVDQLLQILSQERSWQVEPKGAATFTQKEETDFATHYLVSELQRNLTQKMPLKSEHELRTYEPLFQESNARKFADLGKQAKHQGQAHCKELAAGSFKDKPYYAEFVSRYCAFWGIHPKLAGYDVAQKQSELIRAVSLSGSTEKLPATGRAYLQQKLTEALQDTPWYSAEGARNLQVPVNAEWDYHFQKIPIQLVHHYQQPEKYVEYVDVTKTRRVPYEVTEAVYDPQTHQTIPVKHVRYRDEAYTEKSRARRLATWIETSRTARGKCFKT